MACERYRDALSGLAAGVPAPGGVEAHLAVCADCRAQLAALRRALALVDTELAELRSAEPSAELAARIRSAVAASGAERAKPAGWLWPLLAAALLVAVAVIVRLTVSPAPEVAAVQPSPPARETPSPEAPALTTPVPTTEPTAAPGPSRRSETSPPMQAPRPTRAPAEPEVLVPPGEAEALLRFAASLQQRAVSRDSLLVADLTAPLVEPAGLEIRPLEIVPLDPEWESGAD